MTNRTVTMIVPGQPGMTFTTRSGNQYATDANCIIAAVPIGPDVDGLSNIGGVIMGTTAQNVSLSSGKNADGTVLTASASSGKFGVAVTLGTSLGLVGEAATGATKTDDAIFEVAVPPLFNNNAGEGLTITVNANFTGSGTNNASTIQAKAYRTANDGTQGANLGPAAKAITGTAADYTFSIPGATLNPGDRLVIEVEAVTIESGGSSSITTKVNSVRVQ